MGKNRLEAFSDGMFGIFITVMVLELRVPEGSGLAALRPLAPVLIAYVVSFIYIAIYWNNHHHMLHTVDRVTGAMLWANMHLLFWLSLIPFGTAWLGRNHLAATPTAVYGVPLLMAAVAYWILQGIIIRSQGEQSILKRAVQKDLKGKCSIALYAAAIPLAYVSTWISAAIYVGIALVWLVPDTRIERVEKHHAH